MSTEMVPRSSLPLSWRRSRVPGQTDLFVFPRSAAVHLNGYQTDARGSAMRRTPLSISSVVGRTPSFSGLSFPPRVSYKPRLEPGILRKDNAISAEQLTCTVKQLDQATNTRPSHIRKTTQRQKPVNVRAPFPGGSAPASSSVQGVSSPANAFQNPQRRVDERCPLPFVSRTVSAHHGGCGQSALSATR